VRVLSRQSSVFSRKSSVVSLSRQSLDDCRQRATGGSGLKTGDSRLATDDWRLTTAATLLLILFVAVPARAALTEGRRLAAVYDTILSARFDEVESQIRQTCPPAPVEACQSLRVVAAWWEILINPESRALDARFNELAASSIAMSEAWTRREPQRAEAWFYLAASYAPLVQWRVLRGERVAAAREGKKIKDALERALQLDPSLNDAYFGIGLYHYYADVAPTAAKILRFLLFLPGGDRVQGLKEMLQARDHGEVLQGEADYQLAIVYLWYEHNAAKAVEILERLDTRYAHNPLFLQQIAEIRDAYFHDHPASAGTWLALLERARAGRVHAAALTEARGRLGLAVELDAMFETDRAIAELQAVVAAKPDVLPPAMRARALLVLGQAHDRLGHRDQAVEAYNAVLSAASQDVPPAIRERARAALRQKPDASTTEAYRLSLEGWRALERGAREEAERLLARAVALSPSDLVARYRYAKALDARGDTARARDELEKVINARPPAPGIVLASAFVDYARLIERSGDRARALTMYRYAIDVVGGDPRARNDAMRAVKRLAGSAVLRNF
jgi:tetratricopeptide (TPR) repeat protein